MTSEKQKLIQDMIERQLKFIAFEHEHGLNMADYFAPGVEHPLTGYTKEYSDIAKRVIDLAHAEKESKR